MTTKKSPAVIRLSTLKDFQSLIPGPTTVFLTVSQQTNPRTYGSGSRRFQVPYIDVSLVLSGTTAEGLIGTLTWTRSFESRDGYQPATGASQTLIGNIMNAREIIATVLKEAGYSVLDGQLAVPTNLSNMTGVFECLQWDKQEGDTYSVQRADPTDPQ